MPPPPALTKRLWDSIAGLLPDDPRPPVPRRADRRLAPARGLPLLRGPGRALPARLRPGAGACRGARADGRLDRDVQPSTRRARSRSSGRCTRASSRSFGLAPDDGRGHAARADQPRLHQLPARRRPTAGRSTRRVAALLPCYWIYWEVGKTLARAGSPDPLYQRWIATYGADEFGAVVRAVLAARPTGSAPASAPPSARAMRRHFATTSRYEWMFWDMGWRRERWPV